MAAFLPMNIDVGTQLGLPVASTVPAGTLYYAFDAKLYYLCVLTDGVNTRGWITIGGPQATNLDLYVNQSTGNDNNPGTLALPLATIPAAVLRANAVGWTGYCHINISADTYVLAATSSIVADVPMAVNGEPMVLVGTMIDSGIGQRVVSASTAGSGVTFATVTDSVGGLTVNAFAGMFLRYTSGTQAGKRYVIKSNSASVFTLCGTQSVPANNDTFVVEKPGTVIRTANNVLNVSFCQIGAQAINFDGQGSASANLNLRAAQLHHSSCWFSGYQNVSANYQGALFTIFATTVSRAMFPSLGLLQTVGSFFNAALANAQANTLRQSAMDFQQCLFSGVNVLAPAGGYFQIVNCAFEGASAVAMSVGAKLQMALCRFEGVTAIAGDYATAAVVIDEGSSALIQTIDISNCTALAIAVTGGSTCNGSGITGSGNVGASAVTVLKNSRFIKSTGNTVTATTPGNDVQVGTNAATSAWATVNAGSVPESTALGTNTFCLASN